MAYVINFISSAYGLGKGLERVDPKILQIKNLHYFYSQLCFRDGVQMLGSSNPLLVHPAALSSIAAAAPEAAHQLKRPRIDSRGTGAPTAPLTIDTKVMGSDHLNRIMFLYVCVSRFEYAPLL